MSDINVLTPAAPLEDFAREPSPPSTWGAPRVDGGGGVRAKLDARTLISPRPITPRCPGVSTVTWSARARRRQRTNAVRAGWVIRARCTLTNPHRITLRFTRRRRCGSPVVRRRSARFGRPGRGSRTRERDRGGTSLTFATRFYAPHHFDIVTSLSTAVGFYAPHH